MLLLKDQMDGTLNVFAISDMFQLLLIMVVYYLMLANVLHLIKNYSQLQVEINIVVLLTLLGAQLKILVFVMQHQVLILLIIQLD